MHKLYKSEEGVVSIIVTMIMIIIISLVVVGFAQLARSEERQALDRQLSTEAYYAANSAINNTAAIVNQAISSGSSIKPQTISCNAADNSGGANVYNNNATLWAPNVLYTCIQVYPDPTSIQTTVAQGSFYAVPIQLGTTSNTPTGMPINSITFTWNEINQPNTPASCSTPNGNFPAAASWPVTCPGAVLEVNLVPDQGAANNTVTNWENTTKTYFIYPKVTGVAGPSGQRIYQAACSSTSCTYTIPKTDLPLVGATTASIYYLRVTPIYENISLAVTADSTTLPGVPAPLYGAQVEIDATGRAQDILQRLTGRVDINNAGGAPLAVQTGGSLCKTIEGYPGYVDANVNGTVYTGPIPNPNSSCYWQ